MQSFDISRGVKQRPQKVVIYGQHGIGKSTLAASFPGAVFIDTEGGTDALDVARLPNPVSWFQLVQEVAWASANLSGGTIVIDSVDWAERLCTTHVCQMKQWESIESPGYGKGYVAVKEEFSQLIAWLDECIKKGVNVVLIAHEQVMNITQPGDAVGYATYGLKLSKHVTPLVKEWADAVLYCHYRTVVIEEHGKGRAVGGTDRVMQCTHTAVIDAKNRWGIEGEQPMAFDVIQPHIPGGEVDG